MSERVFCRPVCNWPGTGPLEFGPQNSKNNNLSKIHEILQLSQFEGVENNFSQKIHLDPFLGLFWGKSAESAVATWPSSIRRRSYSIVRLYYHAKGEVGTTCPSYVFRGRGDFTHFGCSEQGLWRHQWRHTHMTQMIPKFPQVNISNWSLRVSPKIRLLRLQKSICTTLGEITPYTDEGLRVIYGIVNRVYEQCPIWDRKEKKVRICKTNWLKIFKNVGE